jgi:2-methylcitrate dehydratase PrpD
MSDTIARSFARWSAALTFEDLPAEVVDKTKAVLLQALVGGVYGLDAPRMREVVALVAAEEGRPDGATVLGTDLRASRIGAAYANTELMYGALLYDYFQAQTHPGPVLVSAALVNAELGGKDLRAVLTALAAGYEVQCRLADRFVPSTFARGYRPGSVYPTIGAAVVTAKLMGLDEDGMLAAIALAVNSVSGLVEGTRTGASDNVIHLPNAVRAGVFAAVMASTGRARGSETVIEGEAGFYNAVTGNNLGRLAYAHDGRTRVDLAMVAAGLGETYRMLETTFHMYALHGAGMPVIDLLTEMRARHHIDAAQVDRVTVRVSYLETVSPSPAFPRRVEGPPGPTSIAYFAAHVAVHGGFAQVGGAPFGHEADAGGHGVADDAVLAFARDHVAVVGEYGRPAFSPQVEVRMQDGTTYVDEHPYARMFWDYDALVARLESGSVARYPLGRARFDALVDAVRHAERLDSVAPLYALVARDTDTAVSRGSKDAEALT